MGRALVGLYCASFRQVPRRIVLDLDDTFDPVHGGSSCACLTHTTTNTASSPLVVFDGEGRPVAAMLRPARRPTGAEARSFLRRLVREIRATGHASRSSSAPTVTSARPRCSTSAAPLGSTSPSASPPPPTLRRHVTALEASTAARQAARPDQSKLRRNKAFFDGARSWSRVDALSPASSRTAGHGHPLHRHELHGWRPAQDLRGGLLRAWSGGEPHQGVETPPRGRTGRRA